MTPNWPQNVAPNWPKNVAPNWPTKQAPKLAPKLCHQNSPECITNVAPNWPPNVAPNWPQNCGTKLAPECGTGSVNNADETPIRVHLKLRDSPFLTRFPPIIQNILPFSFSKSCHSAIMPTGRHSTSCIAARRSRLQEWIVVASQPPSLTRPVPVCGHDCARRPSRGGSS